MRAPDERQKIWNDPLLLAEWTVHELNCRGSVTDDWPPVQNLPRMTPAEWRRQLISFAKSRAREGRPEQLRKLFPEIAEFIHAPPLARGQHYAPQFDPYTALLLGFALEDVREIHQIWREHFGKAYAPRHGPTALEIAARRHEFPTEQLLTYRKNRHRQR